MIRLGAFIWLAVLTLIGVGLYQVELGVLAKEAELRQINHRINADRDAMHVLGAEWSYLNDPTRLADLARRYTDLIPTTTTQIATFDQLPPRPSDTPPSEGLPDGTLPHPDGTSPDSGGTDTPLLSSNQAPDVETPTGGAVMQATVKTQKPAQPTDEQAEADGVIDAILADMRKAQKK